MLYLALSSPLTTKFMYLLSGWKLSIILSASCAAAAIILRPDVNVNGEKIRSIRTHNEIKLTEFSRATTINFICRFRSAVSSTLLHFRLVHFLHQHLCHHIVVAWVLTRVCVCVYRLYFFVFSFYAVAIAVTVFGFGLMRFINIKWNIECVFHSCSSFIRNLTAHQETLP